MTTDEILTRARSVIGKKIIYKLGSGGMDPKAITPAGGDDSCDCSGFVDWAHGFSRFLKDSNTWENTDAIFKDANTLGGIFTKLDKPIVGCIVVYPKPAGMVAGHIGIVSALTTDGAVAKVIHCSSGNYRKFGDAVQETGASVFLIQASTIYVRFDGLPNK